MRFHLPMMLSVAAAAVLAASSSYAASTVCSYVTKDTVPSTLENINSGTTLYTPTTTIIVASNFYKSAQVLAHNYLYAVSSNDTIGVCHNSTGHIITEIFNSSDTPLVTKYGTHSYDANEYLSNYINRKYSLFLSANVAAAYDLVHLGNGSFDYVIGTDFLYAWGIPALYTTASNIGQNQLVSSYANGPEGYWQGASSIGPVQVNTSYVNTIAIAKPSAAPYGAAAVSLLTAMGQWTSPWSSPTNKASDTSSTCASGSCQYDNIDLTYTATDTTKVNAGFIAWSQVCDNSSGGNNYVTFPDFALEQHGVQLETDSSNGVTNSSETLAQALLSYMNIGSGTWDTFLESRCYGPLN